MKIYKFLLYSSIYVSTIMPSSLLANPKINFRELMTLYLKENIDIDILIKNKDVSKISRDIIYDKKRWQVSYNGAYLNSDYESYSSLSSRINSFSNAITFFKPFNWGGQFSFTNNINRYDNGITENNKSFEQRVEYSQSLGRDLFGRDYRLEKEISELSFEYSSIALKSKIERGLLELFKSYVNARVNKKMIALQKKAIERSARRRIFIRKLIKDGLKEDVDLLQAKMSVLSKKEELENIRVNLEQDTLKLSQLIHKTIRTDSIIELDNKKSCYKKIIVGKWSSNNYKKELDNKLSIANLNGHLAKNKIFPKITLSLGHGTNKVSDNYSNTISNGNLLNGGREFSASILISSPLSFSVEKHNHSISRISYLVAEKELEIGALNFKQTVLSIKKRIEITNENIKTSSRSIKLAERLLKRHSLLYRLGKSDLEQIISAEEILIGSEKKLINYIGKRDVLIASLAQLYGKLHKSLLSSKF